MRFVIQRVLRGKVTVENNTVGEIERGLVVLVGINKKDTEEIMFKYADKLLGLRLWDEVVEGKPPKRWQTNLVQNKFGLLLVSQFTLFAKMKGNKPDFHGAMDGEQAKILFDKVVARLRAKYTSDLVQTGAFGQMMSVEIINDGPVTLIWDSDTSGENPEGVEMADKE